MAADTTSTHARAGARHSISDWDEQAAATGEIALPGGIRLVPETPLIGASVEGLDLTKPLDEGTLGWLTDAFLRYKVLMVRSHGQWQMDIDQHTRFCQQISAHWNLQPDTPQKTLNHSAGLSVHPFLPWQKGYPHVWPTSSVTGGGKQYELRGAEQVENFEPFAGQKLMKQSGKPVTDNGMQATSQHGGKTQHRGNKRNAAQKQLRPGSFGAAAMAQDKVKNGANGFHFDDGFFHEPPSAVVLNSLVLPSVGGDTIFADMGAAYRGLSVELQELAKGLTQTMDWRHAFPIWEQEAQRRIEESGDHSFAEHVEQLKRDYPPSQQPVIRQHPVTGELSIYANLGFTRHINDVSPDESQQLLALLCRMAERPEYQVRLRWQNVGDVCIYDNRITNHYAVSDYGEVGPRALHHIALLGEPTKDADGEIIG